MLRSDQTNLMDRAATKSPYSIILLHNMYIVNESAYTQYTILNTLL